MPEVVLEALGVEIAYGVVADEVEAVVVLPIPGARTELDGVADERLEELAELAADELVVLVEFEATSW